MDNSQKIKRNLIWRHNGYLGSIKMASSAMRSIESSLTATVEAKVTAIKIDALLGTLKTQLKKRKPL